RRQWQASPATRTTSGIKKYHILDRKWCCSSHPSGLPLYPHWVKLDTFGRGDETIHVRYASNSDQGGESQRNVAMCQSRLNALQQISIGSRQLFRVPFSFRRCLAGAP